MSQDNPQSVSQTLQDPQTPVHIERHREQHFDFSNLLGAGRLLGKVLKGKEELTPASAILPDLEANLQREHVLKTEQARVKNMLDALPADSPKRARLETQLTVLGETSLFKNTQDRIQLKSAFLQANPHISASEVSSMETALGGVPVGIDAAVSVSEKSRAEGNAAVVETSAKTGLSTTAVLTHNQTVAKNNALAEQDRTEMLTGNERKSRQAASALNNRWAVDYIDKNLNPILVEGGFKTEQEKADFLLNFKAAHSMFVAEELALHQENGGQIAQWEGERNPFVFPKEIEELVNKSTSQALTDAFTAAVASDSFVDMIENAPGFKAATFMSDDPAAMVKFYYESIVPFEIQFDQNESGMRTRATLGRDPALNAYLQMKDAGVLQSNLTGAFTQFLTDGTIPDNTYVREDVGGLVLQGIEDPSVASDINPANVPNLLQQLLESNDLQGRAFLDPVRAQNIVRHNPDMYTAFEESAGDIARANLDNIVGDVIDGGATFIKGPGYKDSDVIKVNGKVVGSRPSAWIAVSDPSSLSRSSKKSLDKLNTHLTAMYNMNPKGFQKVWDEIYGVTVSEAERVGNMHEAALAQKMADQYLAHVQTMGSHLIYVGRKQREEWTTEMGEKYRHYVEKAQSFTKDAQVAEQRTIDTVGRQLATNTMSGVVNQNGKSLTVLDGMVVAEDGKNLAEPRPFRRIYNPEKDMIE